MKTLTAHLEAMQLLLTDFKPARPPAVPCNGGVRPWTLVGGLSVRECQNGFQPHAAFLGNIGPCAQ